MKTSRNCLRYQNDISMSNVILPILKRWYSGHPYQCRDPDAIPSGTYDEQNLFCPDVLHEYELGRPN